MESGVYLLLFLLTVNLSGHARAQVTIEVIESDKIESEVNGGILIIYMHEEIAVPFKFATFTYTGTQTPSVSVDYPSQSPNTYLGLDIVSEDSNLYSLQINITQDYENSYFGTEDPQYVFSVLAGGSTTVSLYLVNINDNDPILQPTTSCSIEENTYQRSACEYIIRDEDGHVMSATWTLLNEGDYYFNFHEDNMITDEKVKERTLIIEPRVQLDFENITVHVMDWIVSDVKLVESDDVRTGTAKIVIQVIDMPDTPPRWTTIFASQQFDERVEQTFPVTAIDGDVEVNDKILYTKEENLYDDLISIDLLSGVISVESIDRDELELDVLQFMIFACEENDPYYCINQTILFIVNDINNQDPLITVAGSTDLEIPENYFEDLNIDMYAHDRDTGQNAMYNVWLSSEHGQEEAFTVAPRTGYQNTALYMYITNYRLLDYDRVETWRQFELTINTEDFTEPHNTDSVVFYITLINLNDEIPYFVDTNPETGELETVYEYIISIEETAGILEDVITVLALDDDFEDDVRYSILGSYINNLLTIDEIDGIIRTRIDGAFDYETQQEIVLQVQATDVLVDMYGTRNSAVAQITINVIDINDETPKISVGSDRVEVEENVIHGFEFLNTTVEFLIGTDDDAGADLIFDIRWEDTYATKTGRRLTDEAFERYIGCVNIETNPHPTTGNGKAAIAALSTIEVVYENTPDYELFDILYLSVVITDLNQEVNDASSSVIVPIYILDVNDEEPVFLQSTIDSTKTVNEHADIDAVIAIIIATDVDSENITYSLESAWYYADAVGISELGELYVNGDIDADEPPLYNMSFTVIASDGRHDTRAEITIVVNDINDNVPTFNGPVEDENIYIYEQADEGTFVTTLYATDIDRDPSNSDVSFHFSSTMDFQLSSYFQVVDDEVKVMYADPDNKLDRDNSIPGIVNTIRMTAIDSNVNDPKSSIIRSFTVTLLDINNQVPVITSTYFEASESYEVGDVIGLLQAEDDDEADTVNTQVGFNYLGVSTTDGKEPPDDMFVLDINSMDIDARTVNLLANIDLRTYNGTYTVQIEAYDHGVLPGRLSEIYEITVAIDLYNFQLPIFIYPEINNQRFFLLKTQEVNALLFLYNGDTMTEFSATDGQDNKYEEINFEITDSDSSDIFHWRRNGVRSGRLELSTLNFDETQEYTVTISAEAAGATPTLTSYITIILQFVDTTASPIFYENTATISFLENETITAQSEDFPGAHFVGIPENLLDDYKVYYIIYGDNSGRFVIEDNTINSTSPSVILDREETSSYSLLIQSSQTAEGIANPSDSSLLTLTIVVLDVNDNPPNFESSDYYAGVMSTWDVHTSVITIKATDLDDNDPLIYSITGYTSFPTNINKDDAMEITNNEDDRTATIITNMAIPDNADGYFLLNIDVFDGLWHDTTTVKIYVINENHRVEFVFQNDYNTIFEAQERISIVLQNIFAYTCVVEAVVQNTDDNGNILENETVIRVHFIDSIENLAVDKSEIENLANDITLLNRLQNEFDVYSIVLLRFLNTSSTTTNVEAILKAWLIAVCVVLGVLLLVLIILFILKTRSLSQRLNKLSVIRYASQESGLNRKVAPTTNKHTIEGSNPAYTEEKVNKIKDFDDTASIDSGDSDLVGIENNPEFEPKVKGF